MISLSYRDAPFRNMALFAAGAAFLDAGLARFLAKKQSLPAIALSPGTFCSSGEIGK
ncbi:MAG: hypothetical protein AB1352_04120 [Patescibacteria group bacterium]